MSQLESIVNESTPSAWETFFDATIAYEYDPNLEYNSYHELTPIKAPFIRLLDILISAPFFT